MSYSLYSVTDQIFCFIFFFLRVFLSTFMKINATCMTNRLVWVLDHKPGSTLLHTATERRLRRIPTMLIISCARPDLLFSHQKVSSWIQPQDQFYKLSKMIPSPQKGFCLCTVMLQVGTLREWVSVPDVLSPRPPAETQIKNTFISHVGFFSRAYKSWSAAHVCGCAAETPKSIKPTSEACGFAARF